MELFSKLTEDNLRLRRAFMVTAKLNHNYWLLNEELTDSELNRNMRNIRLKARKYRLKDRLLEDFSKICLLLYFRKCSALYPNKKLA